MVVLAVVVVVVVVLVVVVVVSEPFGVYIYRSLFNNTSKTDVASARIGFDGWI